MLRLPAFLHPGPVAGLLGLCVLVAPGMLPAADTGLQWWCEQHYDTSYHVRCVVLTETGGTAAAAGAVTSETGGQDISPPNAAGGPGSDQAWWVPLHAPPRDSENVAVLLKSVLCAQPETCRVHYAIRIAQGSP